MGENVSATVLDRLRRLCSGREYCSADIMQKALRLLDGDEGKSREILETLEKESFVSDERYAAAFARDKSSIRGWGPLKIRSALQLKGISQETIRTAMEGMDDGLSRDKLRKALNLKYNSLKEDPQVRIKLIKFALSRGFSYDVVAPAVNETLKNEKL